MSDAASSSVTAPPDDWEQRQKQANFYQNQIGLMQQAAIGWQATAALVVSLGTAMAKYSGVAPGQDWAALFIAVIGWLILAISLSNSFGKTARRIRDAYQHEQAAIFPHAEPYRLESFLLDREKNPAGRSVSESGNRL